MQMFPLYSKQLINLKNGDSDWFYMMEIYRLEIAEENSSYVEVFFKKTVAMFFKSGFVEVHIKQNCRALG